MQQLVFGGRAGGVIDDAVADALLEYATTVARSRLSDVVSIPVRIDGRDARARLLLTRSCSLMVVDADGDRPPAGSAEAAADLRARLAALTSPDLSGWFSDDRWLQAQDD